MHRSARLEHSSEIGANCSKPSLRKYKGRKERYPRSSFATETGMDNTTGEISGRRGAKLVPAGYGGQRKPATCCNSHNPTTNLSRQHVGQDGDFSTFSLNRRTLAAADVGSSCASYAFHQREIFSNRFRLGSNNPVPP